MNVLTNHAPKAIVSFLLLSALMAAASRFHRPGFAPEMESVPNMEENHLFEGATDGTSAAVSET